MTYKGKIAAVSRDSIQHLLRRNGVRKLNIELEAASQFKIKNAKMWRPFGRSSMRLFGSLVFYG